MCSCCASGGAPATGFCVVSDETTLRAMPLVSGAEAIAKVQQTGLAGTFAIGASGGNVMYQTQKDMLRELKEQKELARQQLEEQRKLNQKDGARFK